MLLANEKAPTKQIDVQGAINFSRCSRFEQTTRARAGLAAGRELDARASSAQVQGVMW